MADVDPFLRQWSTIVANNKPTGGTTIGAGLDDNLRQIQATLKLNLGDVFNVKDYGALGDGVTDDTSAIQAAIAAIPISGGGTSHGYQLYFPPGKYLIADTLVIGNRRVSIHGGGASIMGSGSASIIYQSNANKDIIDFTTGSADTFGVNGIMFLGTSTAGTGRGLVLGSAAQACFDGHFSNNWFVGIPDKCIHGINVQGCHFLDNGFDSSATDSYGLYMTKGLDNVIVGNRLFGQEGSGIVLLEGDNNTINSNHIDFCGGANDTSAGIYINVNAAGGKGARGTTICGNNFRANINDIVLNGNGGVNASNTGCNDVGISGNVTDRAYRRFLLATDSHHVNLSGNLINSPSQILDAGFSAVEITGTSSFPVVTGNSVADQTSATTRPDFGLKIGASVTELALGINEFRGKTGAYSIAAGGATFNANTNVQGTWTPTIKGSSTAGTQTYSIQNGKWMRTGNLVWATCQILMTAKDAATAGNISIAGLPFNIPSADNPVSASIGGWSQITLNGGRTSITGRTNAPNEITLISSGTGIGLLAVAAADIAATTEVEASIVYRNTNSALNTGAAVT